MKNLKTNIYFSHSMVCLSRLTNDWYITPVLSLLYPVLRARVSDNDFAQNKKRHLLLLLSDQDQEEAEEGGSKTDAPVGRGNHNIAHKDQYTVIKNGDYDDKDGSDQ